MPKGPKLLVDQVLAVSMTCAVLTVSSIQTIWWRFQRADGAPWALAGLWNTWTDKGTGEMVESYTMILGAPTVTQ